MSKGCTIAGQNGCWLSFFLPWFVSFLRAFTKLEGTEQVQADWKEQVALYHHGCCLLEVWYSHSHWPLLVLEREWLPPIPVASTKLCMCKEGPLDSPSLMSVLLPFVSFSFLPPVHQKLSTFPQQELHLLLRWHRNAAESSALSSPGWPCCTVAGGSIDCACTSASAKPQWKGVFFFFFCGLSNYVCVSLFFLTSLHGKQNLTSGGA